MSDLNCGARSCRYNCGGLCGLDNIEVCGESACTCGGTCCGSFAPAVESLYGYSATLDPRSETDIECEACRCKHNEDGVCDLDSVLIDGDNADRSEDTCCESFEALR